MTLRAATNVGVAGRRIGYARVSTPEQKIRSQLDALKRAGCVKIYRDDGVHGDDWDRPGLSKALKALGPGDQLVVYKLDRLGRSMFEMMAIIVDLDRRGMTFCSLTQSFDTTTALGRGILAFMAAVAEDELDRIRERTRDGIEAARKRGKVIGRPRSLTSRQLARAHRAVIIERRPLAEVAASLGVVPVTLKRGFRSAGLEWLH